MTTYRRIEAVSKTISILRFLSDQKTPVPAASVAKTVQLPAGTVMCHLVTLEDNGFVQRIGEHWKLGMGLALFWARTKSRLESEKDRIDRDLSAIESGGDIDG